MVCKRLSIMMIVGIMLISFSAVQAVEGKVKVEKTVELDVDERYADQYDGKINQANESMEQFSNYNMTWKPFKEDYNLSGVVSSTPHPPHLMEIDTGHNGWLHVSTPVKFSYSQVMQGTSQSWWRSPFALNESDGFVYRLRIYRISQTSGIEIDSNGYELDLGSRIHPTKVYDSENMTLENELLHHHSVDIPKDLTERNITYDFIYHELIAPFYADEHYLPVFSIKNVSSPVRMYFNPHDVGSNRYNKTHMSWDGGGDIKGANADVGVLHTYGQSDYTAGMDLGGNLIDESTTETTRIEDEWTTNTEWDEGEHINTYSENGKLKVDNKSKNATWYSQNISLSEIDYYDASETSWDGYSDVLFGNYYSVYVNLTSWDNWEYANKDDELPKLEDGDDLTGEELQFKIEFTMRDENETEPYVDFLDFFIKKKSSIAMEWWVDFDDISDQLGNDGYDYLTISAPFLYKDESMVNIYLQTEYYVNGEQMPFADTNVNNTEHQNFFIVSQSYSSIQEGMNSTSYEVSDIDEIKLRLYTDDSYDEKELKFWLYDKNNNYSTEYRYSSTRLNRTDGDDQNIGYQIWHSVQVTKGKWERVQPRSTYGYQELRVSRDEGINWRTVIEHGVLMASGPVGMATSYYIMQNYGDTPPTQVMRDWVGTAGQYIIDGAMKVGDAIFAVAQWLWEGIQWVVEKIQFYGRALINLIVLGVSVGGYLVFTAVTIKLCLGMIILVREGIDPMFDYYAEFMNQIIGLSQEAKSMLTVI